MSAGATEPPAGSLAAVETTERPVVTANMRDGEAGWRLCRKADTPGWA